MTSQIDLILDLIDETLAECEYRADNDDQDAGFLYEGSWDHSFYGNITSAV